MEDQAAYGTERNENGKVRRARESVVTALEEIDRAVLFVQGISNNTGELALAGSARSSLQALLTAFNLRVAIHGFE